MACFISTRPISQDNSNDANPEHMVIDVLINLESPVELQ